jgi:hypothetical protein
MQALEMDILRQLRWRTVVLLSTLVMSASLGCADNGNGDPTDGSAPDRSEAPADANPDWVDASTADSGEASSDEREASPADRDAPLDTADVPPDAPREGGGDADAQIGDADVLVDRADVNCSMPVQHGDTCTTENEIACGYPRVCTDIGPEFGARAQCVCQNGRFSCGSCPHCTVQLPILGCGFGQVCDGITLTRCDGTTEEIPTTCHCWGFGFTCEGATPGSDGGSFYGRCPDAGSTMPDADDAG